MAKRVPRHRRAAGIVKHGDAGTPGHVIVRVGKYSFVVKKGSYLERLATGHYSGQHRTGSFVVGPRHAKGGSRPTRSPDSAIGPDPADDPTPDRPFTLQIPVTLPAIVRFEEGGGYSAEVPALPGCHTEADTLVKLRANLIDAAGAWLEVRDELAREEVERTPSR